MKSLTTLTAVVAMIAGIAVAGAQTSSMDKNKSMSGSSAQITGTGKFCVKGVSGALNCQYASLADCQKATKSGESCSANPKSGTTGAK